MKKHSFLISLLIACICVLVCSSCHGPRYYTRYKMGSRDYHQHYNPYRRRWYKWGFQNGVI